LPAPGLFDDLFDGRDDPLMGAAAAEIAVHMVDDLVARRPRIAVSSA